MLVIADQAAARVGGEGGLAGAREAEEDRGVACWAYVRRAVHREHVAIRQRSEEHTSELQSLMRISYAVFCLTKKITPTHSKNHKKKPTHHYHTTEQDTA